MYLCKPPYAIGSVPSLSGHAVAYRWRSLPRVRRHRASKSPGSSERVLPYEVGLLKVLYHSNIPGLSTLCRACRPYIHTDIHTYIHTMARKARDRSITWRSRKAQTTTAEVNYYTYFCPHVSALMSAEEQSLWGSITAVR